MSIGVQINHVGNLPIKNESIVFQSHIEQQSTIALSGLLDYDRVVINTTSTLTLLISNAGNKDLNVMSIDYPSGFSGSWSGILTANDSYGITVSFNPSAEQEYSGTVTVSSDKTYGVNTIAISGTGYVPPTPEVHYKMNDNAASWTVVDSSGWNKNGTARFTTDSMSINPGKINNALQFEEYDGINVTGYQPSLDNGSWSFALWIRAPASTNWYYVLSWGDKAMSNNNSRHVDLCTTGAGLTLTNPQGFGYVPTSATINDGNWHFVAATYNGSTNVVKLYVDNIDQNPDVIGTTSSTVVSGDLTVGYGNVLSLDSFKGDLDDVRFYSVVLSRNEITYLWNNGNGTED